MNDRMQKIDECCKLTDPELTEKELNKVTGGTTGHANQDVAGRHDPLDRNTV
jgi:bacteriocin-like protein